MKKDISINDELKAIQSGEMPCTPEKLAICTAYCKRRLEMLRKSMKDQTVPAAYKEQSQASIQKFADFLTWAETQKVPADAG